MKKMQFAVNGTVKTELICFNVRKAERRTETIIIIIIIHTSLHYKVDSFHLII